MTEAVSTPPAIAVTLDTELPARVAVHDVGEAEAPYRHGRRLVVVFGDELHSVRLIGSSLVIHRMALDLSRQLEALDDEEGGE